MPSNYIESSVAEHIRSLEDEVHFLRKQLIAAEIASHKRGYNEGWNAGWDAATEAHTGDQPLDDWKRACK